MTRERRLVYRGLVVDVEREEAVLPNGTRCEYEVVRHPGGAAAVAMDESGRVCLLRQYRHVAGEWLWEIPAGRVGAGENPLETARRELGEEAGLEAARWRPLGDVLSSPGVFSEVIHLFAAEQLTPVRARPEEHEVLEVHWLLLEEALAMARRGEIRDAKTVVGLFRAAPVGG